MIQLLMVKQNKNLCQRDTMTYEHWRSELFGQPPEIDPVVFGHSSEFYALPPDLAFDYVDRLLNDPDVHSLFEKTQLANGIKTIYSGNCSDLPFLYVTECTEDRRIKGIRNLCNLYRNFFERYCLTPVRSIGDGAEDDPMGFICYMFWDVFVLYPGNGTPGMIAAAVDVMRGVLESSNDNCLMSAIHGLGHWVSNVPDAETALKLWLKRPTTRNLEVLKYARRATTGMIQ
jgi:hypothetical protein